MHIEGPWLSTTGKRKGKVKFRNAEEAKKARELDQSWAALQKRWAVETDDKKRSRAMSAPALNTSGYSLALPKDRDTTAHIKSLDTGLGNAALKESPKYTGTKVLGIGTLHKSNAVPIFSDEEAIDIARMRR